jgi:curved DNA-binding protein CbpA
MSEEEETLLKKVEAVYSRLQSMRIDELLEVSGRSDAETIKKNYYRLAKEFHPDRYFTIADESVRSKLTAIFNAISRAYNVLAEDSLREKYFASLTGSGETAGAEDQFRMGVEEFKKGHFSRAVENFKSAAGIRPGNAAYWNYLSLAFSRIPGRIKDAEEALQTALELEPSNADLAANLGLIFLKAGLRKKAGASFEKALKLDPSNEKARKGLQQIQPGAGR